MNRYFLSAAGALSLLAAGAAAAAATPSPFDGTWRTDMSSINFSKKPEVHVVKGGVATCDSCTPPYSVKTDGGFHPVAGHPEMDSAMVKVVDARTVEETDRKGGRDVSFTRVSVAPDGQTAMVDWKDMTNASAPVATGRVKIKRVSAAPPGAHAASGGWTAESAEASSDATTQTLKLDGDMFTMSTPTGQGYSARVGGPAAPYKGDPTISDVKLTRAGPRELVETDMKDGKAVSILHMAVSPDGKTLMLSGESLKSGRKSSAKAMKI